MFRKKLNSTLFIFLHTLVFIFPLVVKGVHYHPSGTEHNNHEVTITDYQGPCAICDYEFVTFTIETKENYYFPLPTIKLPHSEINNIDYKKAFYCFSHRGPPAC